MLSKPFTASATAIEKREDGFGRASAARLDVPDIAAKPISSLSRRIIFFNAVALIFLMAGVLLVQSARVGLVDERMAGIKQESLIIASTLAEYTTDDRTRAINDKNAEPLLRQLVAPTTLRARLYDTNGDLILDTRNLLARNVVQTVELPPPGFWSRVKSAAQRVYDGVLGVRPFTKLGAYFEAGSNGRVYKEVDAALQGETTGTERTDQQNKLVLSVATPVERFRTVYGVLLLSTEGGDIDDILREERASLIGISIVAFLVMLFSSLYLSGTIAQPIRQLAAAADRVRHGRSGRETIPSMSDRNDEIGDLADSLSAMTRALYGRIDAIERFAADVAHELKNPLTSLKSAAEMLARCSDDPAARERLMAIMRNDIKRIDRLITDISYASRLDAELSRETNVPVDLSRLIETIVEIYRTMELPDGVTIELTSDASERLVVMGLDERLGQIFRNLIDNAVSFSPPGGVVAITVTRLDGRVRVCVEDDGPGIPPGDLEAIFNRFYTQRPPEHGFGKNSGLGLSIARQIAEGVGGRIRAENRRNRPGARFIVELPLVGSG